MLRSHWATVGSGMLIVTVPVPLNAPAGISTFHGPTWTVPPTSPLMMPVARSGEPVTPAGWSQDVLAGSRLTREGGGGPRGALEHPVRSEIAASEATRKRGLSLMAFLEWCIPLRTARGGSAPLEARRRDSRASFESQRTGRARHAGAGARPSGDGRSTG